MALALVIGVVALTAMLRDEDTQTVERAPDYDAALDALCEATARAVDGDLRRANGVFLSRAHAPLHELAAELDPLDRALEARLLESKAAVEATLPNLDPAAAAAMTELLGLAQDGVALVTDDDRPTCEENR